MAKIDIIAEQTAFLLEKQVDVLQSFENEYKLLCELVAQEREKAEKVNAGEELTAFQNISSLLDLQKKDSIDEMKEDVAFLKEQMVAIKQVQDLNSPGEADEITEMMLENGEELADTKQFKADVEQEAEEAKAGFADMLKDIKAVLVEEGVKELELLLEAHEAAKQKEVEEFDEEEGKSCGSGSCSDDDECCGSGLCHDKEEEKEEVVEESCESSCDTCTGCDIFEGLEVTLDDEKKTEDK